MTAKPYALAIHPDAERQWPRLDASVKARFKTKLAKERLLRPRAPKDALHGLPDCYKIKITAPQFRLAYHVDDVRRLVTLLAASSRNDVYVLLKAKCLALMDEVARTGQTLVVTKNGKPVAELRPYQPPRAKSLWGLSKGRIKILGDIVSPVGTNLWKALE